mgnify:CR=1
LQNENQCVTPSKISISIGVQNLLTDGFAAGQHHLLVAEAHFLCVISGGPSTFGDMPDKTSDADSTTFVVLKQLVLSGPMALE